MESIISSKRVDVWHALSDLYLDNEITETDHQYVASVLIKSEFSILDIEEILYNEVHPVLYLNFKAVAGKWGSFDREFVEEAVKNYINRPLPKGFFQKLKQRAKVIDAVKYKSFVERHWEAIKKLMSKV